MKTLYQPDEELNQKVVFAINSEANASVTPKEVVQLLRQRMRMDNPHKQYLAVVLVRKVLMECGGVLGPYQQELLQEVARVAARPTGKDGMSGKLAKEAAKDLLRMHGQLGQEAFQNVVRYEFPRPAQSARYGLSQPGTLPPTAVPTDPEAAAAASAERESMKQSILDEIRRMVEQARSHSEVLNEMLVSSGEVEMDDFDQQLMKELLSDVNELRTMFVLYVEQLGAMEGEGVEELMKQALEASDLLDGVLELEKEVAAANKLAPPPKAAPLGPSVAGSSSEQARAPSMNLIDLDEPGGAQPSGATVAAAVSQPVDPFAMPSKKDNADPFADFNQPPPPWGAPSGSSGGAPPMSAPQGPNMGPQGPSGQQGYPPYGGGVSALTAKSPFAQAGMSSGAAPPSLGPQPAYSVPQQYGPPPPQFPQGFPPMQQPPQVGVNPYGEPQPNFYATSPPGQLPVNPFGQGSNSSMGMAPQGYLPQNTGAYVPQSTGVNPNNPFASGGGMPGGPSLYAPQPTGAVGYPAGGSSGGANPFLSNPGAVEAEWNLFFADRVAGSKPQTAPQ